MADKDYLKSIDDRLRDIDKKLDTKLFAVEERVDELESVNDKRKGAIAMLGTIWMALCGLAAYIGSNWKDWTG